jgi:hypothetical protein
LKRNKKRVKVRVKSGGCFEVQGSATVKTGKKVFGNHFVLFPNEE